MEYPAHLNLDNLTLNFKPHLSLQFLSSRSRTTLKDQQAVNTNLVTLTRQLPFKSRNLLVLMRSTIINHLAHMTLTLGILWITRLVSRIQVFMI